MIYMMRHMAVSIVCLRSTLTIRAYTAYVTFSKSSVCSL